MTPQELSAFEKLGNGNAEKTPAFKGLRGKLRNFVTPPRFMVTLSGADQAMQDRRGLVTLRYVDGSTETRPCNHDIADFDSWLALVSFVQAGRDHV